MQKQQSLHGYKNDDFATNLSSYHKYDVNAEHKNHEWIRYEQTYSGNHALIIIIAVML